MQLTQQQLWYAARLADPSEARTHEELAEEIGVDRATLWRWRQIKGFGELVYSIALLEVKSDLGQIFAVLTRSAKQGDLRAIRLVFELSGILQAQSARKLFNEEVYSDYFDADESTEKLIQVMEEEYTVGQRLVIAATIRKMLDDIDFIKLSFASEEIAIGENAQMQFNS